MVQRRPPDYWRTSAEVRAVGLACVREFGLEAASYARIAARAGVSRTCAFRYARKDDLAMEMLRQPVARKIAEFDAAARGGTLIAWLANRLSFLRSAQGAGEGRLELAIRRQPSSYLHAVALLDRLTEDIRHSLCRHGANPAGSLAFALTLPNLEARACSSGEPIEILGEEGWDLLEYAFP